MIYGSVLAFRKEIAASEKQLVKLSTMTSQPIPQEYFLVGSIMDSSLDVLLHRLRGLCDQLEPLQGTVDAHPVAALAAHQRGHSVQTFHEHEQVYSVKTNVHGAPTQLRVLIAA